jgi:NodT family efflux transporter outer membrane factor (OMF) lipoprotein
MKQIISFSLLSFTVYGCSIFAPEYQQPNVVAPTQFKSGIIVESSTQLSSLQWWQKFNDPLLNKMIIQALKNNNQIKMAQSNILQAQAQLKMANYAWVPTLNFSTMGMTGNNYATNFTPQGSLSKSLSGGNLANSNFNLWQGGFVPNYTFNVFANINQYRLAKANLELQQATLNAMRISVISQISGGYFMLLGLQQQLLLQRDLVNNLTELSKLQQIKINAGSSDFTQLRLLQQEMDDAKTQIPQLEYSISSTENALKILLGENPGKISVSQNLNNYDLVNIIPAKLSSTILKNRPDVLVAEDNLKLANANVGLANSLFFPTISLTGNIGQASVALKNLFSLGTGFWFVQAAANMPVLNLGDYEQIKASQGGYYVAYYNYVQTLKAVFADVDNSLTNYQKTNEAYLTAHDAYLAIQDYSKLINVQYNNGAQDQISLINAKLKLNSSALNLNYAKMQQLSTIVQVYQSLAVGYKLTESQIESSNK